jgi:hypothetical protein
MKYKENIVTNYCGSTADFVKTQTRNVEAQWSVRVVGGGFYDCRDFGLYRSVILAATFERWLRKS